MNFSIKILYWTSYVLTVIVLPLNFGIGLVALSLFILPTLIVHCINGIKLNKLKNHKLLTVFAALNLLVFALVRPDGVHVLNETGLSALFDIFNINAGFNRAYVNIHFIGSIGVLLIQLVVDMFLWNKSGKDEIIIKHSV